MKTPMCSTSTSVPGPSGAGWDAAMVAGAAYAAAVSTRTGQRACLAELAGRIAQLDAEIAALEAIPDRTPGQSTALSTARIRRWAARRGMPSPERVAMVDDDSLWDGEQWAGGPIFADGGTP